MHLNKTLFRAFLISSLFSRAYAGPYDDLYENAVLTSPVIAHIHGDSLGWRKRENIELKTLVTYISEHPDKPEMLKAQVKNDLEEDLTYFSTLSEKLKPFEVGEGGTTYYSGQQTGYVRRRN